MQPPKVQPMRLPWANGNEMIHLALYRQQAAGPAVLYVHGASFPAPLSVGWRMQGMSWMDDLQRNGLDAWAFDMAGFGGSDRPKALTEDRACNPPSGRSRNACAQIVTVLRHIRSQRPNVPIHVIAHSWGTVPARQAAVLHPELISRLVLFGPVVQSQSPAPIAPGPAFAWLLMTAEQQRPRQRTGMPHHLPTPVSQMELDRWCDAYLATDAEAALRSPPAVKIPGGPATDIDAMDAGQSLVDDADISQPTLIVRGEWDHVTTDADAARLFAALSAAQEKRDIKISGGNHWLHLQPQRQALWSETRTFLHGAQ